MPTEIEISQSMLLPSYYTKVDEPSYMGKGVHGVSQLEAICEQYKELVHQLRIREQSIIKVTNAKLTA